jgi:hypothetical protein
MESSPARRRTAGNRGQQGINWQLFFSLIGLLVLIGVFWNTVVIQPLRILVVFFHELSHGFAAIITGGKVAAIQIVQGEGGVCYTLGGNRFLILNAGYLGSLLWGGALLLVATKTRFDKQACIGLGVLMAVVALLWVRPVFSFGFLFTALVAAGLVIAGMKLDEHICDFTLKLIGLVSIVYVPQDIFSDTLARSHLPSDARMLAELTLVPTVVWGALWVLLALWIGIYFVVQASRTGPHRKAGD